LIVEIYLLRLLCNTCDLFHPTWIPFSVPVWFQGYLNTIKEHLSGAKNTALYFFVNKISRIPTRKYLSHNEILVLRLGAVLTITWVTLVTTAIFSDEFNKETFSVTEKAR